MQRDPKYFKTLLDVNVYAYFLLAKKADTAKRSCVMRRQTASGESRVLLQPI